MKTMRMIQIMTCFSLFKKLNLKSVFKFIQQGDKAMRFLKCIILLGVFLFAACATEGEVAKETKVAAGKSDSLGEKEMRRIAEIRKTKGGEDPGLIKVIRETPNYTVSQYLSLNPNANNSRTRDFSIGGYDILDVKVYEEPDLSREGIRVGSDGHISFPLIGRIKVEGLTTSEIERLISTKLAQGQYVLNAHVSVSVKDYKSKQFMVLGAVRSPGTYPVQAKERILDAISKAGGIDFTQGGKQGMVIRTEHLGTDKEEKIVIRIDLSNLLKGGDQVSNLLLADKDLIYVPRAENFYLIGEVKQPGAYPYLEKEITLVEAISKAGGFTQLAARNRTRIVRVENGVEKIIEINVDAITDGGKKAQDVRILPGDVIVVPESFF